MIRDFSDTRLFNHLRNWFGIEKPFSLPLGAWDDWEKNTKRDHPIGYWMTEEFPDYLGRVVRFFVEPFRKLRYYYRNRFRDQLHVLPTRLEKGHYYDLDTRLLHAIMESIVDYVEIELASKSFWEEGKQYKVVKGRCPEAGLDHLAWEMSLDDTTVQPQRAKEVLEIYKWWKEVRPLRPDPMVASGWEEYSERWSKTNGLSMWDERVPRTKEDEAECRAVMDKNLAIEEQYLQEDEDMLIRVMKIRPHL